MLSADPKLLEEELFVEAVLDPAMEMFPSIAQTGVRNLGVKDIGKAFCPSSGMNDCRTARNTCEVQSAVPAESDSFGCTGRSHTRLVFETQFDVTKDFIKRFQDAIYGSFYSHHPVTVLLITV